MIWSTIVVGTDGSETAGRAVDHAAKLAGATGAGLVVVTAYTERPGDAPPAGRIPGDMEWAVTPSAGAEDVARAGAEAARRAGAADVRARTVPGDPARVLLEVADEVGADLVVVGSKGMTSAARFVTGSVPNALSHHTDRDVLIVRTD